MFSLECFLYWHSNFCDITLVYVVWKGHDSFATFFCWYFKILSCIMFPYSIQAMKHKAAMTCFFIISTALTTVDVTFLSIEQIKIRRTYVSDLLGLVSLWGPPWGVSRGRREGWIFVTLDCQKMHLLAPEQLKMSVKNLGGMDMEQKIWKS